MTLPQRVHPRLKGYDYSRCGCYHITICTKNRIPLLSRVVSARTEIDRADVTYLPIGSITKRYIENIPGVYQDVILEKYVIMPNHVHLLITLLPDTDTSVPTIVRSLKRMINKEVGKSVWQESYFDVIIRNDAMYQCEWNYIDNNPDRWIEDELFVRG